MKNCDKIRLSDIGKFLRGTCPAGVLENIESKIDGYQELHIVMFQSQVEVFEYYIQLGELLCDFSDHVRKILSKVVICSETSEVLVKSR